MLEPLMAQPGGNENNNRLMFTRGSSVRFSSTVDDIKSPRSRLKAVINEDRRSRRGRQWWRNRQPRLRLQRSNWKRIGMREKKKNRKATQRKARELSKKKREEEEDRERAKQRRKQKTFN